MNTLYISEEESFKKRATETMRKFGYVYADVNRRRIQMKADSYVKRGFKTDIMIKPKGFYLQVSQ